MFPEFGQTPKCLELDLTSYEESWTHVSAFGGRSGWLLVARATIQSEQDLLRGNLIAACDDYETPIPAWRARHLTECQWGRLDHCYEEPPEILDDLLCEEEGAFYARWQRGMNTELAALFDRAQRNIEALETRASARTRELDLQIADLRRRRRMADVSHETHGMLSEIISELEAKNDQALTQLAERRVALRREADAAEEALWLRTDLLIEVEPLYLVRWRAKHRENVSELLSPDCHGTGGISLLSYQLARPRLLAERRAREEAKMERQAELEREKKRVKTAKALATRHENGNLKAAAKEARAAEGKSQSPRPAPKAKPTSTPRPGTIGASVVAGLPDDQTNAWSVDRVEMLRRLWGQGISANDIGRTIGGVSRNAVIGKAKRLGLPMRAQIEMPARQSTANKLAAEA